MLAELERYLAMSPSQLEERSACDNYLIIWAYLLKVQTNWVQANYPSHVCPTSVEVLENIQEWECAPYNQLVRRAITSLEGPLKEEFIRFSRSRSLSPTAGLLPEDWHYLRVMSMSRAESPLTRGDWALLSLLCYTHPRPGEWRLPERTINGVPPPMARYIENSISDIWANSATEPPPPPSELLEELFHRIEP